MPYSNVPFPFGHCRICQDKATGFHYGVATCEGCKGFFKRSISKGDTYTCFSGGLCTITPFNRNRCKSCRFKRCLDNGMAIDAVKMGRIPQVEKERALLEAGMQTKPQSNMDVDTEESVPSVSLSHGQWVDVDTEESVPSVSLSHGQWVDVDTEESVPSVSLSHGQWVDVDTEESVPSVSLSHGQWVDVDTEESVPSVSLSHGQWVDVDTEESVPSVSLSHSQWVSSELAQSAEMERVTTGASNCKGSLELDSLTYQCRDKDMIASGGQVSSVTDWKNPEEKRLLLKYNPQQLMLNSVDTVFGRNNACIQRQRQTWSAGSVKTHKNSLLEKPSSLKEKTGAFSTLTLSSMSSTKYENQLSSSVDEECCNEPSYKGQLSTRLESLVAQGNFLFPQNSRSVVDTSFLESTTNKTETSIHDYNSTIHCDNPFSESSASFRHQDMANCSYPAPLTNILSSEVFDNKPVPLSIKSGDEKECLIKHMGCEMYTAPNMTTQESSCNSCQNKMSTQGEVDGGNINSGYSTFKSKTKVYRKICYSPDVIKVPMDQVGEDGITGMKQQIMTNIARTFRSDEYEATAQLLTSYTNSSGQQKNPTSDIPKQSSNNRQHNLSSISDSTESFAYCSRPDGSTQHPSCNTLSMITREHDLSSLATSSHPAPTKHSQDLTTLFPTFQNFMAEHPIRLSYSEQQEPQMLKQVKGLKLSNDLNSGQYPDSSLKVTDFEFQDCHNAMDTSEHCFPSNVCPPVALSGQVFADEYDDSIVTASDKTSVRSNSHNSSSDKDSNSSPDSSSLGDLTMAESALSLKAAYDKHMSNIGRKHKRMLDHIHNKKIIPCHPVTPEGKAKVYSNLIASIPAINKSIIGFSHDVPGFVSLQKEDKEVLMKRGYYDIWMLTNSKLFHGDESYLQFDDGTFYTRTLMEAILNVIIVQKLINFAKKLNSLTLSDLEIAILCAIQLTSTSQEPLNLNCPESIQQINSHFVDLLVQEVSKQHPSNCSRILVDIFRLMPDLSEINLLQREIIANFSINEPPEKVEYRPKAVPLVDISEKDLAALADS